MKNVLFFALLNPPKKNSNIDMDADIDTNIDIDINEMQRI